MSKLNEFIALFVCVELFVLVTRESKIFYHSFAGCVQQDKSIVNVNEQDE